jgi:hypothetical protein
VRLPPSISIRRAASTARATLRRLARAVRWARRPWLRRATWAVLAAAVLLAANAVYQIARKPTELLALVAPSSRKLPHRTWAEYGPLFEAYATTVVDAPLLAALAQVESGGDPLASPAWRWRWRSNPLEVYAPPSSAVGLLQITRGNLEDARRLCLESAARAAERPRRGCGTFGAYFRVVPSHAVELTAGWLDASVTAAVLRARRRQASPEALRQLAAVIHLCGRERGVAFAQRGFWVLPGERCGQHDLALYLARVGAQRSAFVRIRDGR